MIRFLLAVFLGIVFVAFLPIVLVFLRVNDTFLEPQFYANVLVETDLFNFFYDEALPLIVDENIEEAEEDYPSSIALEGQDVSDALRVVAPPEWLQSQAEHLLEQLVPYATGRTDSFRIDIPLSDRVEAVSPALKQVFVKSNAYDFMSTQEFEDEIDQRIREFGELPFGIEVTAPQVVSLLQEVLPASWIQQQTEANLDRVAEYLTTEGQDVIVVFPLADRVQAALAGGDAPVKVFLRDIGAYDEAYREGVAPLIAERAIERAGGGRDELVMPIVGLFELSLSKEDITTSLQQAPPEEIQGQIEGALDQLMPYLTGESERFSLQISVGDAGRSVLGDLIQQELRLAYQGLPVCTLDQVVSLVRIGLQGEAPICSPGGFSIGEIQTALGVPFPGLSRQRLELACGCDLSLALDTLSYDDMVSVLGIDVESEVEDAIDTYIPSSVVFSDTDLRDILSRDDEETLDRFLDYTRNGFVYTDADLRRDMVEGDSAALGEDTLDRMLDYIRHGFVYTEQDLRDDIAGTEDGPETLERIDLFRSNVGTARSLAAPVLYAILALLLAAVAFLGGRNWRGRVMWAAAFLVLAAAITYVGAGPAYDSAEPWVQAAIDLSIEEEDEISTLLTAKATESVGVIEREFSSEIKTRALYLLAIGLVALTASLLWQRLSRLIPSRKGG